MAVKPISKVDKQAYCRQYSCSTVLEKHGGSELPSFLLQPSSFEMGLGCPSVSPNDASRLHTVWPMWFNLHKTAGLVNGTASTADNSCLHLPANSSSMLNAFVGMQHLTLQQQQQQTS